MKKLILACIMAITTFSSYSVPTTQGVLKTNEILHNETETFKVYGNCGMCKKRIESSLKDVKGVSKATWDVKSKMMKVTFDPHVISLEKIKTTIASVGHDVDGVKAEDKIYNNLPNCCQYDRVK